MAPLKPRRVIATQREVGLKCMTQMSYTAIWPSTPPTTSHFLPTRSVTRSHKMEPAKKPIKYNVPGRVIRLEEQQSISGISVIQFVSPFSVSKVYSSVLALLQAFSWSHRVKPVEPGARHLMEMFYLSWRQLRPQMVCPLRVNMRMMMSPAITWKRWFPPTLWIAMSVLIGTFETITGLSSPAYSTFDIIIINESASFIFL